MMPSSVDCPVPYRLSKKCLVFASLTATTGNFRTPAFSIALRRMTPVVVSSVPPRMPSKRALRSTAERPLAHCRTTGSTSASRPSARKSSDDTRSAPSSIVMCGAWARAARMWS
jgi:hypothetical protein